MELIAAVFLAGPLGYFGGTRKRGLVLWMLAWAVIFPIQTAVVFSSTDGGDDSLYWVFNGLILSGGIGLNLLGSRLRERRADAAVGPPLSSAPDRRGPR